MKKTLLLITILSISFAQSLFAQNYYIPGERGISENKLTVEILGDFNKEMPISIVNMEDGLDRLDAVSLLERSLLIKEFHVVSESIAEDLAKKSKYKSVYLIRINYRWTSASKCRGPASDGVNGNWYKATGSAIALSMSGSIYDLANDGKIIAVFKFSQNTYKPKCTEMIMKGIAYDLSISK